MVLISVVVVKTGLFGVVVTGVLGSCKGVLCTPAVYSSLLLVSVT